MCRLPPIRYWLDCRPRSGCDNDFATPVEGATVLLDPAVSVPTDKTFYINGTLNYEGILRPNGSILYLAGSLGAGISWLDVRGNSTINFIDGARFDNSVLDIELRDNPTLGFELSESGFTPLEARYLANATDGWSAVTINVDVRNYNIDNGTSVVLMDFDNSFDGLFTPTINLIAGDSGLTGSKFQYQYPTLMFTFDTSIRPAPAPLT